MTSPHKLMQIFSDSADCKLAPTHANVDCSDWCQHSNNSLANHDMIDVRTYSVKNNGQHQTFFSNHFLPDSKTLGPDI